MRLAIDAALCRFAVDVRVRWADGARVCLGESTQVRVDAKSLRKTELGAELTDALEGFERALAAGTVAFPPRMA